MKYTMRIISTLVVILVFTLSCDESFLEVKPTGSITDVQLTSKAGLEGTLIGAYSMLTGRGGFYSGSTNWFWGSVLGGEANKGTNAGDQAQVNEIQAYDAQPSNTSVEEKYRVTYEGVARCNAVLRLLPEADASVSAADLTRIEAEARFLRAHYYFELKKIYDDTPYIDESVDYSAGLEEISNDADLWPMIESDFSFAYANLPESMSAPGRANKWAAGAYLGKTYLFEKKFTDAKTTFDQVIASGKTASGAPYALMPNYGDLWRIANDNNAEIVFAIQSAAGTGTINNAQPDFVLNYPYNGGPAGCCGFFQPSFELVNSFRTDANGLPMLTGAYNTGANQVKTDEGVASATAFTPDAGNLDPRLDWSVGRRGIPFMDHGNHPGKNWIRDQDYGGPYAAKKFVWSKAEEDAGGVDKSSWTPGYSAINVPIMRYADVLLMAAEAEIEVGTLAQARTYVNMVRTRAMTGEPVYTFVDPNDPSQGFTTTPAANYVIDVYPTGGALDPFQSQAQARTAVQMERKLEMSGEGQRFYDLVRWGIAETTLNAYLNYERAQVSASPFVGATFTPNRDEYLPIPQREIDILGKDVLHQNPGY